MKSEQLFQSAQQHLIGGAGAGGRMLGKCGIVTKAEADIDQAVSIIEDTLREI